MLLNIIISVYQEESRGRELEGDFTFQLSVERALTPRLPEFKTQSPFNYFTIEKWCHGEPIAKLVPK